jgi:hypothetical protein
MRAKMNRKIMEIYRIKLNIESSNDMILVSSSLKILAFNSFKGERFSRRN